MISRILLFLGLFTLIVVFNFDYLFSTGTKELRTIVINDEHAQVMMSKELYQFYCSSDKSLDFYEIYWKNKYLLNYNPKKQTLHISMDICSGWLPSYYVNVSESKLEELSKSGLLLEEYDKLLEKAALGIYERVKTNGCMG